MKQVCFLVAFIASVTFCSLVYAKKTPTITSTNLPTLTTERTLLNIANVPKMATENPKTTTTLELSTAPRNTVDVTTTAGPPASNVNPQELCCEAKTVDDTKTDIKGKSELTSETESEPKSKSEDGNSDKAHNPDTCVNLGVRLCSKNDCMWYGAKCVDKVEIFNSTGLFPVTKGFDSAYQLLKLMWDAPPTQGNQLIWLVFLVAPVVIAALLIKAIIWLLIIYIFKSLWAFCWNYSCKKNKKRDSKKRGIVLIMPDGKEIPLDDHIIDCSEMNYRAKAGRKAHDLFKSYHASTSTMSSSANGEKNRSGLVRTKEDLEVPSPSWPYQYEDDDNSSSNITAKAGLRGRLTSSKSIPQEGGAGKSTSRSVSCSKYVNPAFSESSLKTNKPAPKNVVIKNEEWEDCREINDVEEVYQEIQDDGIYAETVVSAVDETADGATSSKYAPTLKKSCLPDGIQKQSTQANLQDFSSKLKKVIPPEIPVIKPKVDGEHEKEENTEGVETRVVEANEVETSVVKTSEVETNEVEVNEMEVNEVEANEVEISVVKTNEVRTDEVGTDEVGTDEVEKK